jgi:hypothetical protein
MLAAIRGPPVDFAAYVEGAHGAGKEKGKGSSSFLKKRTKKLLPIAGSTELALFARIVGYN